MLSGRGVRDLEQCWCKTNRALFPNCTFFDHFGKTLSHKISKTNSASDIGCSSHRTVIILWNSCPALLLQVFPELGVGEGEGEDESQQPFALRLLFWILAGSHCHFTAAFNSLSPCSPLPPLPSCCFEGSPWGQQELSLCSGREPGKQCRSRSQADLSMAFFFSSLSVNCGHKS